MLRLGIISNPFAKMNKNCPEHNTQLWYTLANEGQYQVTHSIIELEKVCQEFCERKINLVGIVGGDGSIGLVLSNLLKAYRNKQSLPKILLLKGGTINFLASNLGMKTSALTCLHDSLFFIKKQISFHEVAIKTLEVNGRLGFIFAGGIACSFLEEFYKNKTNSFGAAVSVSKYLVDGLFAGRINGSFKKLVKPEALLITTKPNPLWEKKKSSPTKEDYTLVFASTVPSLPLHFKLFRKINLGSGTAEMLVITEKGAHLLKGIFKVLAGGNLIHNKGVDSVIFKESTIQSDLKLNYSLDGDLFLAEDNKIEIKLGPSFIFCSPYYIPNNDTIDKGI